MKRSMLYTALLLAVASQAPADMRMTQVTTVEPMEYLDIKIPEKIDTAEVWFGESGVYYGSNEMTSIVRPDLDMLYVFDPEEKQYFEFPLSALQSMDDMLKQFTGGDSQELKEKMDSAFGSATFDDVYREIGDSDQARQVYEMMQSMQNMFGGESGEPVVSAVVTETEESKKIGSWQCTKFLVEIESKLGMAGNEEIWATTDVDVDYMGYMTAIYGNMAGFAGYAEMMQEFGKIKGIPIYTLVNMEIMGSTMKTATEVISLEEQEAPAGIYEVPDGYEKVDISEYGSP
jgi:hypothetical protein